MKTLLIFALHTLFWLAIVFALLAVLPHDPHSCSMDWIDGDNGCDAR